MGNLSRPVPQRPAADRAQEILGGIRDLACRLSKLEPSEVMYRIKPGGELFDDRRATVSLYVSVQNVPADINTQKARRLALIKKSFCIRQDSVDAPLKLSIHEWNSSFPDGKQKEIWSGDAENLRDRQEMARLMAEAIQTLVLKE
jgi:hypothetical protein